MGLNHVHLLTWFPGFIVAVASVIAVFMVVFVVTHG